MALLPRPPTDVRDTILFKELTQRSQANKDGLLDRVERIVDLATPMLDLVIAGPFRNYTLHNPGHSRKLVHLAGCICSEETLRALSSLELAIIISAAYLHDLAMSLSSVERERLVANADYLDYLQSLPDVWHRLEAVRDQHAVASSDEKSRLELEAFQLQEVVLSSFLRVRHATRERYNELFESLKK